MILTAHQPVYMPWPGLFHKIFLADMFCMFDIAQYQTKDYNNRNKIKTNVGELWLTVPVESKDHYNKKICDIRIINNGWNKKHLKSITKRDSTRIYSSCNINSYNHKHAFVSLQLTLILRKAKPNVKIKEFLFLPEPLNVHT